MDIETLLAVEDAVETAQCAMLKEAGASAAIPEFSDETKETPLYEIKLTNLVDTKEKYFRFKGVRYTQRWGGVLVTRSVTWRGQNSDQHSAMLTRVRIASAQQRINKSLAHHVVAWLREISTARQHITEQRFDVTEMHHEIVIEIKDLSLPSET